MVFFLSGLEKIGGKAKSVEDEESKEDAKGQQVGPEQGGLKKTTAKTDHCITVTYQTAQLLLPSASSGLLSLTTITPSGRYSDPKGQQS